MYIFFNLRIYQVYSLCKKWLKLEIYIFSKKMNIYIYIKQFKIINIYI